MSLPLFPAFKPVGLEDRDAIESYLHRYPAGTCEMSFPNILIWKDSERPRAAILNRNLCLLLEPTFEPPYFLPPSGDTEIERTIASCLNHTPRLSRVPEALVRQHGASFRVEERRDDFDYVYRTADLAELKGKKFDGKRNQIKKFESRFDHAYERLSRQHVDGCRRLLDEWCESKGNSDTSLQAKKSAILEALALFEALELKGGVVLVKGRVEAFTLGSRLAPDTALIQIEIANPAFPGLAQWINREFVRREWLSFPFINREQDMGLPGLRKAKLSYQPIRFEKKFDLFPVVDVKR